MILSNNEMTMTTSLNIQHECLLKVISLSDSKFNRLNDRVEYALIINGEIFSKNEDRNVLLILMRRILSKMMQSQNDDKIYKITDQYDIETLSSLLTDL